MWIPSVNRCYGLVTLLFTTPIIILLSILMYEVTWLTCCVAGVDASVGGMFMLGIGLTYPDMVHTALTSTRNMSAVEHAIGFIPYSNLMVMSVGVGCNWLIRSMQAMVDDDLDLGDNSSLSWFALSMIFLMLIFIIVRLVFRTVMKVEVGGSGVSKIIGIAGYSTLTLLFVIVYFVTLLV